MSLPAAGQIRFTDERIIGRVLPSFETTHSIALRGQFQALASFLTGRVKPGKRGEVRVSEEDSDAANSKPSRPRR